MPQLSRRVGTGKGRSLFALLEHTFAAAGDSGEAAPAHWDFLIEVPGQSLLATWRLSADPCRVPGPLAAERIADHRPIYLTYEGPLSNNRGDVRRVEGGNATVIHFAGDELVAMLEGARLWGQTRIWRPTGAGLWFAFDPGPRPAPGGDI